MVYFPAPTKLEGKNTLLSLLITFLFVLIFAFPSLGGTLLHVEVRACKDNFGGCLNPLEDAEVYINGEFVGITDHAGRLRQNNLRAGRYRVQVGKDGWKSQTKIFRASSNEYEEVTFTLKRPQTTKSRESNSSSSRNRVEERSTTDSRDSYGSETRESRSSGEESSSSKNISWLILKFILIILGILTAVWIIVLILREVGIWDEFGGGDPPSPGDELVDEIEQDLRDLMGEDS